jgi:sortase A
MVGRCAGAPDFCDYATSPALPSPLGGGNLGGGNIDSVAQRDTIFRPLRVIRVRDVITLRVPAETSSFAVTNIEVLRPSHVEVLAPAPVRDLTLMTCYPFSYIGHAPLRFIVHASRIG